MSSIRYNVWSDNSVNTRGMNYSEGVLNIIFDKRNFNFNKYKPGKYYNNQIKQYDYDGEFILIEKDSQEDPAYVVLGPGAEYTSGGNTYYSCRDYELECLSGEGTAKQCNKNKCVWGSLEAVEGIYKYTPSTHEEFSYYTISELKTGRYSFFAHISEVLPPIDDWNLKNIIILQAYSKKCAQNEACINAALNTNNKQELYLSFVSYLNTLGDGWKEYILSLIDSPSKDENLNAYQFCLNTIKLISSMKNKILLYRLSNEKYKNFKIIRDTTFSRPVYYRLPETYRNDQGEKDIIFMKNLEQRFFLPKENLDIGTIVVSSDLSSAYYFIPRAIYHPLERLEHQLDPFDIDEKYSPLDVQSWRLVPEENIPKLNISKWLTEGYDKFLSFSHSRLERFFHDFLDPETCFDVSLDWIYQFFGWSGDNWNLDWDTDTKRGLLKNSLGWADNNIFKTIFVGENNEKKVKTYKGRTTGDFPFDEYFYETAESFWIDSSKIQGDYDTPEGDTWEEIFWGALLPTSRVFNSQTGLVEETEEFKLQISKRRWRGIWESKGTLLCLIFMFSAFKFKNSVAEDEIYIDPDTGLTSISLKNIGTQNKNRNIPLKPVIISPLQASGLSSDLHILENPLIAGMSQVGYDEPMTILPVSYKYARNGDYWQNAEEILDKFAPVRADIRIQYPYMAADFGAADDFYFEYEIPDRFLENDFYLENNSFIE